MIAFTCPHCGGSVRYDLSDGAVRCEYCDSLITQDDYEGYLDKKGLYQTTELSCPQCGSVVLSYDNTLATFCSYCGSSVLFNRRVKEEQKPDGIIPFSFQQKAAENRYRKRTDKIILAPEWMREEGRKEMTGIYMPFYLYRADCEQPVRVKGEKHRNLGSSTEVSVYEVDGTLKASYQGNRFDAAVAFPDALSETMDTYKWQNKQSFRPGYIAGYYADGSDVDPEEYDPVAAKLVSDDINASGSSVAYQDMTLNTRIRTQPENIRLRREKILLPVWLLTHRVGDRICYAAVNGQTGDVAADIPLDRGKYLKVSLIAAAVIATFMNFMYTIKPAPFLTVSMIITTLFGFVLGRLTNDVYVRENHLDDIGRIGYPAFAEAVKTIGDGRSRSRRSGCSTAVIYGIILFLFWPFLFGILSEIFPDSVVVNATSFLWIILITLGVIRFISGLARSVKGSMRTSAPQSTRWKYSKSLAASFAVLWKVWLALAGGAAVMIVQPVVDTWYYGAGIANILVSVWAAFDVIRKQNMLASRDIPLFSMKRGGAE
ncbi:MAG: zinc ribbon domain-containing protein [Lachnospiraceae bacterium]|nr:zinc ribbon domain-containing protein [Lachnospiraceae bacterium]